MRLPKILVLGATGKTGRKVVELLANQAVEVRHGSRQAEPAFDWNDASNWPEVFKDIDTIYITFQPDLAIPGALEAIEKLIKVAVDQKVRKLVLLSGKGEKEAELSEQLIMHSGLEHVIIRASWFNQNFSESFFLGPILEGKVALPMAQAKVPYVDTDDIAAVAAKVIREDGHNGQIYEMTGSELFNFKEVIELIAEVSGRDISFTPISVPAYIGLMEAQGVDKEFIWLIQYLFTEVINAPGNDHISSDIEQLLGRPPKRFKDFVMEANNLGFWHP